MSAEAEQGQGSILGDEMGHESNEGKNAAESILGIRPNSGADSSSEFKPSMRVWFDHPPLHDVLCAEDIRAARLDRDGMGRVHHEIKHMVLLQVLRSIATEQIGASAAVKALAVEALKVCE